MGLTQLFNNAPKVTVSSLLLSQHPQQGPFPSLVSRCISKQHVLKVKHEEAKEFIVMGVCHSCSGRDSLSHFLNGSVEGLTGPTLDVTAEAEGVDQTG